MVMTTPLKKPDQNDDGQAADADDVHLEDDVVRVMGAAKEVAERTPGENVEILEGGDGRLQEIEQTGPLIYPMLPRLAPKLKKALLSTDSLMVAAL